jgi:hypothetical protein
MNLSTVRTNGIPTTMMTVMTKIKEEVTTKAMVTTEVTVTMEVMVMDLVVTGVVSMVAVGVGGHVIEVLDDRRADREEAADHPGDADSHRRKERHQNQV